MFIYYSVLCIFGLMIKYAEGSMPQADFSKSDTNYKSIVEIDFDFESKVLGELHYNNLLKRFDPFGQCWKEAMSDLNQGCKHLTEEVQSRLALAFSNCFLNNTGLEPWPCPRNRPISVCLRNSSDRIYNVYTEFYTHTHSICHYLQHKEWLAEAAKIVLMLTQSSAEVSRQLEEYSKVQSKILDLQNATLYGQNRLMFNARVLNVALQKSKENARHVYNEFKMATNEHRLLLFEVFDRVQYLQNFVLGEFSGVYTFAYYVIAALITYMTTSIPRTAEARLWLILVITLNAAFERILTLDDINEGAVNLHPLGKNELVYCRIWLCRKIACFVGFIILIVCYYRYKDYNVINNKLLQEIQRQNVDLQAYFKGLNSYENLQYSLKNSSTKIQSVSLNSVPPDVMKNIDIRCATPKNLLDDSPSMKISPSFENKENTLLNTIDSDKMSRVKKQPIQKKMSNNGKSPNVTSKSRVQEANILSEVESPGSQRYNLRRNSKLNSPQLSPFNPNREGIIL